MHRKPNNVIYKTVVVLWLTLSIASVVLALITWVDFAVKLRISREAVVLKSELAGILQLLVDAETSQRGFTITGDDRFLAALTVGETTIPGHFDQIMVLAKEDPQMMNRAMELRAQAEVFLSHHRRVVGARREEAPGLAAEMVASGEGMRMMEGIRSRVAELGDMRQAVVFRDASGTRGKLVRASMTSVVAGIMGVGAGIYAFWLARVMLGHQDRERRLVEDRLRAERSSHEKTVFLANMSHEIRTPMNAILGFSELLAAEVRDAKQGKYVRAIQTSARSLLRLINDILDMSKIEAGVMDLRLEPTNPREICDFLLTLFAEPAAKKRVKLQCTVDDHLPRSLLLDRIRLRQVMVNLVGNAVKFTDSGSIDVRVTWERQPSASHITLVIKVIDTGVGIPKDKLDAIFKPFVQAGAHIEKEKTGTGLGLSIVRRLSEIMRGTVTAASEMGRGSAFSVRIPDVAVSARIEVQERLETDGPCDFNELRPASILVVDDNAANCEVVAGFLSGSHHRLTFGASGEEAVEKAQSLRLDIILLDIRMPGLGGRGALAAIRKLPAHAWTPVIAVTASALLGEETELKERFDGYVRKPFSKRDLFSELAHFLPQVASEEGAGPDGPSAVAVVKRPVPPELLVELRRLQDAEWPAIRDGLAINESQEFAAKLLRLARQWTCAPLETYAHALAEHAANYSVVELEDHVSRFPEMVGRLEESRAA